MTATSRRRGADAERAVVAWMRDHGWPDARRYMAGDGRQPGDIDAIPGVSIEVKDRDRSSWPTWRAQAVTEAEWRVPIVVRRTRGTPDVGLWRATIPTCHVPDDQLNTGTYCVRTHRPWAWGTFAEIIAIAAEAQT